MNALLTALSWLAILTVGLAHLSATAYAVSHYLFNLW